MHCHIKLAEQKGHSTIKTLCSFLLAVGDPARIGVKVTNKHSLNAQLCIWLRFLRKKG